MCVVFFLSKDVLPFVASTTESSSSCRYLHTYYYHYYYFFFQENAGTALPRDTAVCHSGIAGDFTTAAQERVEGVDGAQSLLATPG